MRARGLEIEIKQCIAALLAGFAVAGACASPALPTPVRKAFSSVGLSEEDVAVWVAPASGGPVRVAHRALQPMAPASIVKTVTTLAGLELLGPDHTWKTVVTAAQAPDAQGTVRGVVFHGTGDPHFVAERIWLMAERLKASGVRTIEGDIAIDRSAFSVPPEPPEGFDGRRGRTYNVPPDAAMVNLRTMSLEIEPQPALGVARIVAMPGLDGVEVQQTLPLVGGACYDWKTKMDARLAPTRIRFLGGYPKSCGRKTWPVAIWNADSYFTAAFAHVFSEVGIVWLGRAKGATGPGDGAWELASEESEPLSVVVRYINKYSNNPMARHLFLTLSYSDPQGTSVPATLERGRAVLTRWMRSAGVDMRGIHVDNGSGLSRQTRLTAQGLGTLLQHGAASPFAAEFRSSLPIAGIDGTMKKRGLEHGWAHIKTGRMSGVRSAAGYVKDKDGKDWVVVAIVNSRDDEHTEDAIDRILAWVGAGAP